MIKIISQHICYRHFAKGSLTVKRVTAIILNVFQHATFAKTILMAPKTKFDLNHVSFPAKSDVERLAHAFAAHCEASAIHWCDGSEEEYQLLCEKLVNK